MGPLRIRTLQSFKFAQWFAQCSAILHRTAPQQKLVPDPSDPPTHQRPHITLEGVGLLLIDLRCLHHRVSHYVI